MVGALPDLLVGTLLGALIGAALLGAALMGAFARFADEGVAVVAGAAPDGAGALDGAAAWDGAGAFVVGASEPITLAPARPSVRPPTRLPA
jgi:hypothetical protein